MRSLKLTLIIFLALAWVKLATSAGADFYRQDHKGKSVPEYYGGDECLFCHRFTVGQHWQKDSHFRTVRGKYKDAKPAPEIEWLRSQKPLSEFSDDVDFVMGGKRATRYLRRDGEGNFEILSSGMGIAANAARPLWQSMVFAESCIGCHMTGVDPMTLTPFESFVGCEACHGPHNPEHTNGAAFFMRFAKKAKEPAQVIASTCGSCHLRGGRSKSTGRPYPGNFVAGDNLFKDFAFDLSKADDPGLNPIDAHVQRNIRDIVVDGKTDLTCLSCHKMHPSDTFTHRRRAKTDFCSTCHEGRSFKERKKYEVHSPTCGY